MTIQCRWAEDEILIAAQGKRRKLEEEAEPEAISLSWTRLDWNFCNCGRLVHWKAFWCFSEILICFAERHMFYDFKTNVILTLCVCRGWPPDLRGGTYCCFFLCRLGCKRKGCWGRMSWGRHRTRSNHYAAWFFTFFSIWHFHETLWPCKNLWLQIHPVAFSGSHRAGNCWATALWGRCWLAWPEGKEAPGRPTKTRGRSQLLHRASFIRDKERVPRGTTGRIRNLCAFTMQAASLKLKQAESQGKGEEVRKVGRDSSFTSMSLQDFQMFGNTYVCAWSIKYVSLSSWLMHTILSLHTDILKYII